MNGLVRGSRFNSQSGFGFSDGKSKIFIPMCFFLLGVNVYHIYIPLFLVVLFVLLFLQRNILFRRGYLYLLAMMLLSTMPLYLLGRGVTTIESPTNWMIITLFNVVVVGYILQSHTVIDMNRLLKFYISGIGFEAAVVTIYSFLSDSSLYGYGKLYNPFVGEEINSPLVNNNLGLFSVFLLIGVFYGSRLRARLLALALIVVSVLLAVYLSGRAFFVILLAGMILIVLKKFSLRVFMGVLVILGSLVLAWFSAYNYIEVFRDFHVLFEARAAQGLDDVRFEFFKDGVSKLIAHPFGGFSMDTATGSNRWYHNVFLDNGRLAGWLPVVSLLVMLIYILFAALVRRSMDNNFAVVMLVMAFLIMQQDVIVEANYRMIYLFYFLGIVLTSKDKVALTRSVV